MESCSKYFIKSWLNSDIDGIRSCLAKDITYIYSPSKIRITGQKNIIDYLDKVFKINSDNDVSVKLLHINKSQNEFQLLYQYAIWQPEPTLMINNFFAQVVSAIEPREFNHHVSVKVKIKNDRICDIIVLQEVTVLRKTPAQIEHMFASENGNRKRRYDQYIQ